MNRGKKIDVLMVLSAREGRAAREERLAACPGRIHRRRRYSARAEEPKGTRVLRDLNSLLLPQRS